MLKQIQNKSNHIREFETEHVIFSHICFEIAPKFMGKESFSEDFFSLFKFKISLNF